MRFCMDHWTAMRAAVTARGMEPLVADSGEEMALRTVRELNDGPSIDSFDPLMSMHWAIVSNLSDSHGPLILLNEAEHGTECPLCFANESHRKVIAHPVGCTDATHGHPVPWNPPPLGSVPGDHEHWYDWMIDRAADDALEQWKGMRP